CQLHFNFVGALQVATFERHTRSVCDVGVVCIECAFLTATIRNGRVNRGKRAPCGACHVAQDHETVIQHIHGEPVTFEVRLHYLISPMWMSEEVAFSNSFRASLPSGKPSVYCFNSASRCLVRSTS